MTPVVSSKIKSGILITSVFSIIAAPLAYVRNWLLSLYGSDVVANFAIILLITNLVNTFLIFGASTVYSTFLPKINYKNDQSKFIISSISISLILTLSILVLIGFFPKILLSIVPNDLNFTDYFYFLVLFIIIYGLGSSFNFALVGLQKFKLSAFINSNQTFILVFFLSIVYFYNIEYLMKDSFLTFVIIIGFVWLFNLILGIWEISKDVGLIFKWYLPTGFWNQAIYAHLGTILSFTYVYIDQLLILGYIGKIELASYFLISQIARLVNFLTVKLTNVIHTSFSSALHHPVLGGKNNLEILYVKVARYTMFFSFSISIILIVFGADIMKIFGKTMDLNESYLYLLIIASYIATFGPIHGTIILTNEKNKYFFSNSVFIVVVQVSLSLLFVQYFNVFGIILAKMISQIFGQIGLAYILINKLKLSFYKLHIFIISLITMILSVIIMTFYDNWFVKIPILLLILIMYFKLKLNYKTIFIK